MKHSPHKLQHKRMITNEQLAIWIDDYLLSGYGDKVLQREWKGVYLRGHAPWSNNEESYHRWLAAINHHHEYLCTLGSFEEIHAAIKGLQIKGIGPFTIYDTAVMIASSIGQYPQHIHLHSGAAKGAEAIGIKHKVANKEDFVGLYPAFDRLMPVQIEDFLCAYHTNLLQYAEL